MYPHITVHCALTLIAILLVSCSSNNTSLSQSTETGPPVSDAQLDATAHSEASFEESLEESSIEIDPTATESTGIEPAQTPGPEPEPPPPDWQVTRILDRSPTSSGQLHTQQTPIDTKDGYVYIVAVEVGANGDGDGIRQTTTIKQGKIGSNQQWNWRTATISNNTIYDRWHTPPSVGVDRSGIIHVAYNMHNTPWQYVVSSQPHNLDYFEFKGQEVSDEQFAQLEFDNVTKFDSLGTAVLPGSQITYPAFYKDHSGQLFLTYRAAAKPARPFWERTMSGILASYDEQSRLWKTVGTSVQIDRDDVIVIPGSYSNINALAAETGWTVYHPKLAFTESGDMHVMWFWRPGIAGSQSNRPCHAHSSDGANFYSLKGDYLNLPITSSVCGNIGFDNEELFHTIADLKVDALGQPHVLVSPVGQGRQLVHFNYSQQQWIKEESPSNASQTFFDKNGRQWAIADGIKLLYRNSVSQPWTVHYEQDHRDCYGKMVWNEDRTAAFIHTQDCNSSSATVYELKLTN